MSVEIISVGGDDVFELSDATLVYPFPFGLNWTSILVMARVCIPHNATITGTPRLFFGFCGGAHPPGDPAVSLFRGLEIGAGSDLTYDSINEAFSFNARAAWYSPTLLGDSTTPGFLSADPGVYNAIGYYVLRIGGSHTRVTIFPLDATASSTGITRQQMIDAAVEGQYGSHAANRLNVFVSPGVYNSSGTTEGVTPSGNLDHVALSWSPSGSGEVLRVTDITLIRHF